MNGRTVLAPPFAPHPNDSGELVIGSNLIGTSPCASHFSGRFLAIERLPG